MHKWGICILFFQIDNREIIYHFLLPRADGWFNLGTFQHSCWVLFISEVEIVYFRCCILFRLHLVSFTKKISAEGTRTQFHWTWANLPTVFQSYITKSSDLCTCICDSHNAFLSAMGWVGVVELCNIITAVRLASCSDWPFFAGLLE